MRSDDYILRDRHVRDELALQRRLGAARRAASTFMPTLRRTGLTVKPATGAPMGRQAGQFTSLHNIAVDHQGNILTAEVTTGQRIQKFRRLDAQD